MDRMGDAEGAIDADAIIDKGTLIFRCMLSDFTFIS